MDQKTKAKAAWERSVEVVWLDLGVALIYLLNDSVEPNAMAGSAITRTRSYQL